MTFLPPIAQAADARKVVIPFDFVSKFDDGRYGRMVGEMIWKKLSRDGGFIVPESMQEVRDFCAMRKLAPSPDVKMITMHKIVREDFDAQIGVWGSIERVPGTDEDVYDLTIKCVDFSDEKQPRVIYDKKARTKTVSEAPHLYVKQMLDALGGRKPGDPLPSDPIAEENWKKEPNLLTGDFQQGADGVPKGWSDRAGQQREPLGGQVCWGKETDNSKNRLIRFILDKQTAETTGVMYYSDYFAIEEGAKYRFQCRWRSDGPAVKVFIKCYDYLPDEGRRREVYRSQQNLVAQPPPAVDDLPKTNSRQPGAAVPQTWNTHTEDFTPRHTKYSPRWGRVMLYAYLAPGVVEFDDVVVKRIVPASPGERSKVRRHSSQSDVTLEEMENNRRRGRRNKDDK